MRISDWSSDVCSSDLIEDRWGGASLPMGQCHGDWIPPNMSVARDGSYNLWDWELSDGDTPLGIDAMHFILQMEPHSGRSASAAARRLCRFGREALLRVGLDPKRAPLLRSEEHTSELQSLMRISYAVFCLKKKHIT